MLDLICDFVGFVVEIILEEVVFGLILWFKWEKYFLIYLCCGVFVWFLMIIQVYCKRI